MRILFTLLSICLLPNLFAQNTFQKIYTDPNSFGNVGSDILETTDGDFIISATRYGSGGLVKMRTDSSGDLISTQYFRGNFGLPASIKTMHPIEDSAIIFLGETWGGATGTIGKINNRDSILWWKGLGSWSPQFGQFNSMIKSSKGFIISGASSGLRIGKQIETPTILEINDHGDSLWVKTYRDTSLMTKGTFQAIQGFPNGNILAAGICGEDSLCLLKVSNKGKPLWSKGFPGKGIYKMEKSLDSGFVLLGISVSKEIFMMKLDSAGNYLWGNTYYSNKSFPDVYQAIRFFSTSDFVNTKDGGYAIIGSIRKSSADSLDVYLIKTNDLGDTIWTSSFGSNASEVGLSLIETMDNGYAILAGRYDYNSIYTSDVYLIKTNDKGSSNNCLESNSSHSIKTFNPQFWNYNIQEVPSWKAYVSRSYTRSQLSRNEKSIGNLEIIPSITNSSCELSNDGEISLSLTGGLEPYTYQWSNGSNSKDISGLASDYYTVTVSDSLGCSKSKKILVSSNSRRSDFKYTVNGTVVNFKMIDPNNCTQNGFLWDYGNGNTSSLVLQPTVTYSSAGSYTACLQCSGEPLECVACATIRIPGNYSDSTRTITGIQDQIIESRSVIVYPNPATNELNLKIFSNQARPIQFRIYNGIGEAVVSRQIKLVVGNDLYNIDISTLSDGIYLIEVLTPDASYSQKLMINN